MIRKMLIYETSPLQKIVGEVFVREIIYESPDYIWQTTGAYSGITKFEFYRYFKGKNVACAILLGKVHKYNVTKSLSDYGIARAPQSFIYM